MDLQLKNGSKKLVRTSHIIIDIDTKDFLELFDSEVIQSINKIRVNIDEIRNLEKSTIRADIGDSSEQRLEDFVDENHRLSRRIQALLKSEKSTVDEGLVNWYKISFD